MGRGLTKETIVTAGLAVLDEAGLDGLTVRLVADKLGVKPPALYWHVRNKQELLDEMTTEIWRRLGAEIDALTRDLSWDRELFEFAAALRRRLLTHRDGAKMISGTYLTDPAIYRDQEARLSSLVRQGFTIADASRATKLLYDFVTGFCIEEQAQAGDGRYSVEQRSERVDTTANPHAAAMGETVFGDPDKLFGELVAMVVDAAGRLRTASGEKYDSAPGC
ncbi:TetR/AcrR family transcriptional regulator C-terminal domain-containing protein [Nocardia arthritidis]|uniref:TetR family transcriptional regulator n=1 Tax=Nocardia arthritidis TaxID=228602 RepID=A0A6G9YK96_9NOCA|nr:TetR/AcrR family transcriptional regulator C-terminal domain-containing protein [Nocardia arthritidis]QIS13363.1 TetR family transcriptional regulator [Nocardia arthritidis]